MSILATFFGPGNDVKLGELSDGARSAIEPWIDRWREGRSPTFLPRTTGSKVFWYGLTDDHIQRRELQELLRDWVGPACSDVLERRGALDPHDAFDQDLDQQLPRRVVRIEVWPRNGGEGPPEDARKKVRQRLEGLVSRLDERPKREARAAVSLPALLDELDLAATTGESERALDLLGELERRRLLDAPNTTFAKIRVKALLGRQDEILEPDLLAQLDGLRIPPGVVLHLARAFYDVRLRAADVARDSTALLAQRTQLPGVLRHVLRQGGTSPERSVNVARAVAVGDEAGMATLLAKVLPDESHLLALLATPLVPSSTLGVTPPSDDTADRERMLLRELTQLHLSRAHEAVIDIALEVDRLPRDAHELIVLSADELDTDAAARDALLILERDLGPVSEIEWPTKLIGRAVAALADRLQVGGPVVDDWDSWFQAVVDGRPPSSLVVTGMRDWPPLPPSRLLEWLDSLQDAPPLARVLGALRAAHADLDVNTRGALARSSLMVLAISDRSDADIRSAATELVADILDSGVARDEVDDLLDIAVELVRTQLTVGTFPWAIDIMTDLTGALAVTARDQVAAAWHRFFDLARAFAVTVPRARWQEVSMVVDQVGLTLPSDIAVRIDDGGEEPDSLSCLAGRRILLYSLRERAARQAASRIESAGAEVEISTAHGGSPQLEGQVEGSDLVVIVTVAAKHAATRFIEDLLRHDPIRVNSAGMSSILMALEEHCMS